MPLYLGSSRIGGVNLSENSNTQVNLLQEDATATDYVVGREEVIFRPDTAAVGQTIVVKSVDENGKPTEWEATDMTSGSGSMEKLVISQFMGYLTATTDEIREAINNGRPVYFQNDTNEGVALSHYLDGGDYAEYSFVHATAYGTLIVYKIVNETLETYTFELTPLAE